MRIRSVLALLAGSILVHAAVSCVTLPDAPEPVAAVVDAVADVVHDVFGGDVRSDTKPAEAAPGDPPPTVDAVPCDRELVSGSWYAEKSYPGRTATDLSRATVVACGGARRRGVSWDVGADAREGWLDRRVLRIGHNEVGVDPHRRSAAVLIIGPLERACARLGRQPPP